MRFTLNTGPCGRIFVTISGKSPPPRKVKPRQPFSRSTVIWASFVVTQTLFCETSTRNRKKTVALNGFHTIFFLNETYYILADNIQFQRQLVDLRSAANSKRDYLSTRSLKCRRFDEFDLPVLRNRLPVQVCSVHWLLAGKINLSALGIWT